MCKTYELDSNVSCTFPQAEYKRRELYRMEPAYRISGKEEDIQWEIMTKGPVQGEADSGYLRDSGWLDVS